MKKISVLTLLLILLGMEAFTQTNFFTAVPSGAIPQGREAARTIVRKKVYRLNEQAMRNYLRNARLEFQNNGVTVPLEIPLPDGTTETFNMVESPVLSPKVAAANPTIKTYTGNGTRDKNMVLRLSLTSLGFNAVILNVSGDAVYFESYSKKDRDLYFSYFAKDARLPANKKVSGRCGVDSSQESKKSSRNKGSNAQKASGGILRTFRLAVAANGEFTAAHGGSQSSAFAVVVNYVNTLTAVYRNELSVSFTLVSGTNIVYTDASTDPYDNSSQSAMLDQNQSNLDLMVGSANYDIGHVLSTEAGSGGGVASLESLCDASIKGRGVSGEGDGSYAQVFNDQLFCHEIGHQFGMTHSYNSSIPVCTTRSPATSVEPGSGATIMSYGFTCDEDDYFSSTTTGPILNFHTVNYDQAEAYMNNPNPGYGNCYLGSSTGNTPPVVTVPGAYTIPKSTPFALTGSASDANGDALTYSWEGTNIGTMTPDATTLANTAQPPFFRSYAPVASPTRIYPLLSAILDGSNYAKGDKLPSVSIVTTHRLTVRDNNAAGGGVDYGSVTVTVDGNIGPFLVTNDLSGTYNGNSSPTVTWSVNGTNSATPNVKISLSTDGGITFPTVLAASTPNDGSQSVTLPNISTTTARIKVEAVGNIFFDISNANFSINPVAATYPITATAGANGSISPSGTVNVSAGANQTFAIMPNSCYKVADVLVDGVSKGAITTYTFTNVTASHTISATFAQLTYTITASAGANGSISPNGSVVVNCGASRAFTITPASGYAVQSVLVNGVSQGAVTSYTFNNVTAPHTISASFALASSCVPPTVSAMVNNVMCKGDNTGSIILTTAGGTGPFTYAWTGPNGFSATSMNIAGLKAGTYNLVLTAKGGCTVSKSYTLTEPASQVSISVAPGTIACAGGTTTVNVSASGGTPPYTGTGAKTNQAAGSQTYTVTDANGCSASKTIYIMPGSPVPPTPVIYGNATNLCGGGNVAYRTGPSSYAKGYTWTVPNGFSIVSGQGTPDVTIKVPVNFTTQADIKVSAFNDCGANQGTLTVYAVAGDLSASITGPSAVAANQQNVEYKVPFTGLTYTWAVPPGATIVSGQGSYLIKVNFGNTSGTVKVTASNACGSSPQGSKTVTVGGSNTIAKLPVVSMEESLKVYPNPVSTEAVVFFSQKEKNSRFELIITDQHGRRLQSRSGLAVMGENKVRLNLGRYANGVYWVTLKTDGRTQSVKLMKMN